MTEQPHAPRRPETTLGAGISVPTDPIYASGNLGTFDPVCSEQDFLGNEALREPRTDLDLEAEVHATHAVKALESGERDAGIAWLQSALAFALNARHAQETAPRVINLESAFSYDRRAVRP